ncbi:MAG: NAD(P)/FAD-dependent oxidoreductase [Gemmatimonadota bacterium]
MERALIVGNGYAGLAAARTLARENGFSVTVVSAERHPASCLHLLPEVAAGRKEPRDLYLASPGEYEELGVVFRAGARADRVLAGERKAILSTGEEVPFDKALLATGARTSVPAIFAQPMAECANVLSLRRPDAAVALRTLIAGGARHVVIAGAGRIGVLLAEALKDSAATVTLIDIAPQILATMLDPGVAARLRPELDARANTRILTGSPVERVGVEGGRVREVGLSGGTRVPCDVLVVATGVTANSEVLEGVPSSPDGVPVNGRMETAAPGIYAAGDVVAFQTISGRIEPGQLILNARMQGEVAARNMAGGNAVCPPSFTGNVVKVGPLTGARVGDIDGTDHADVPVGRSFLRLTLSGVAVVGLQFVGAAEDLRGLVPAVLKRFDCAELSGWIGETGFGVAPLLAARGGAWA